MASKPQDFTPPRRIETDYFQQIERALYKTLSISKESTPLEILNAFANIHRSIPVLEKLGARLAERMVTQLRVSNAHSWRAAAAKASRGREIYQLLRREMYTGVGTRVRELVAENAQLISSLPAKIRQEIDSEILRLQQEGERPEVIAQFIHQRIPKITKVRAALVARTETGKASVALTQARSENLKIEWYQWQTSEDQRVRDSHRLMDKVLVAWNNPPSPESLVHEKSYGHYPPGGIFNCRCDAYPLVSLDQVSWPARVYSNGIIQRMSRREFAQFSGIERRVAA